MRLICYELKDLLEKATTGQSNTIYNNIDKIGNKYVLFRVYNGKKRVYKVSEKLNDILDELNKYEKEGWPLWETNLIIFNEKLVDKKDKVVKIKKTKNVEKVTRKTRNRKQKLRFKSDKYYKRDEPVYDASMLYIPENQK